MTEALWEYCIFLNEQGEDITTENLKMCFDNFVHELNLIEDRDVYILSVDSIVTNLLNINPDQFGESIILGHPFVFVLRDLTIELLQKKNNVIINLITLFTKFYLNMNDDNLSKLHILFVHQPLLDVLVHYRINEEFSNIIEQFLFNIIRLHENRYNCRSFLWVSGTYLDEVGVYLCSSAYIDTFNHLFTRLASSDESPLDHVEEFYLITCPMYVNCSPRENISYMQLSTLILEKMSQVYVDILIQFTKIIKNCSQIIIEPVTWLIVLLQCISVSHEISQKFNISQKLIDVIWPIVYELSVQQESHTRTLLACMIAQMFYATFETELLPKIKQIDMISTLLDLLNNGKTKKIQVESCRLLAVVMTVDDIQNRLTNKTEIITLLWRDLKDSTHSPVSKLRIENSLLCLKNLLQNNEIKMEYIKQKPLPFLVACIIKRDLTFVSITGRQRILEILLDLTTNEKVFALLKQDHLFLFHVKNLLSTSEQGLQQAAQAIVEKLDTYQNAIDIPEEQVRNINISHGSAIFNNDEIMISYSPDDKDICYQIRDQLVNDNFRVKFGLDSLRRSTLKTNVNAIECPKIVLLCISNSYAQNVHCQWEVEYASEHQYRIIPSIVKPYYRPVEWLQKILTDSTFIDFNKFEFEYSYEKLKMEITQQQSQFKRNLNQCGEVTQHQKMDFVASPESISMDEELFSTIPVYPVSIHAVIKAIDENWLLKAKHISEETFVLIWFDPNTENVHRTSNIFCQLNDFIRYYTDLDQCVSVIKSIVTSKIVLVTAVEVAQDLLSHVIALRSVDSVLIYANISDDIQFKLEDYPKKAVRVFSNFNLLEVRMIRILKELDEHLQMRRSFSTCNSKKDVIYDFGDFLWLQMFFEAAQIMGCSNDENNPFSKKHELIRIARIYYRSDSIILKKIDDFMKLYKPKDAIHWYTSLNFPYELLNKALRTENLELVVPFLFFIVDLRNCLAREHGNSIEEETVSLYRGINIPFEEFDKLKQMKGELISLNGFLSTSRSRDVAKAFSGSSNKNPGNVAVIFEIKCDASILDNNLIFADVVEYSRISDEEEVLIDIGAVFRLKNIKQDLDGSWVINMMGSTEISSLAKKYIESYWINLFSMKYYVGGMMGMVNLITDRSNYKKGQEHLEQLLDKSNGEEIAAIYATMTRAQEVKEDHEILIRDHYDYTRKRLSKEDFKQSALALNKIGFFLPRNEQLRNSQEILKMLCVNEDLSDESSEMKSLAFVLPHLGDSYRSGRAKFHLMHALDKTFKNRDEMASFSLKIKDLCINDGLYDHAKHFQQLAFDILDGNSDDNQSNSAIMETLSNELPSESVMKTLTR